MQGCLETCCHILASVMVNILVLSLTVLIFCAQSDDADFLRESHGADYCALSDGADQF